MKMIEDLGMHFVTNKSKNKHHIALYECPHCKNMFRTETNSVNSGRTKSCGCVRYANLVARNTKHGFTNTRIYRIWKGMKNRCYNNNTEDFNTYGNRGITVCDQWRNDFMSFYKWSMQNNYQDGFEIDRINNDGNYCPENCRWVTHIVNCRNRGLRSNNTSGYIGIKQTRHKRWVSAIVVNYKTIYLGVYGTKKEAAQAYNNYVVKNDTQHTLNII